MSKVVVFLLTALFVLQYDNVRGNPLLTGEQLVNIDVNRNARFLSPVLRSWPPFPNSWSLPRFPFFPLTNLFKNVDNDAIVLKKKITAMEESQKEILDLLRQYTTGLNNFSTMVVSNDVNFQAASKTQCNDKVTVANDGMQPGASDIADDKKEEATEGIEKNQAQSICAMINGDNTDAVPSNIDKESAAPTEVEEKEETPLTNDDTQTHVVLNENEESETTEANSETTEANSETTEANSETTEANSEKAGSAEEPEEAENSDATQELSKPQYDHSMEKNEQSESLENDTIKSNTLAVDQDGGESGVEVEDSEEQTQASGNEDAGENAPIE